MEYKLVECHPSIEQLEKCMNKMARDGWSYKAPLSGISEKFAWVVLIFERRLTGV